VLIAVLQEMRQLPRQPKVLLLLQSGFLGSYPFDPLGQDSPAMAEREIKNGRLGEL
jgi:hypothetical protein